jgi:hypothetical protein
MLDITELERDRADAEKPVRREVLRPNGLPYPEPAPVLLVIGSDSEAYRAAARKAATERALKRSEIRNGELSTEEADALARRFMAELLTDPEYRRPIARAALVGWENVEQGGAPLAYTDEHAERLLQFEHVLGQVELGAREHRDFFYPRSTSS